MPQRRRGILIDWPIPAPVTARQSGQATRPALLVVRSAATSYLSSMTGTPAFLDGARPDVPDIVVPRGITPFYLPGRPVRGGVVRPAPPAEALLPRHQTPPAVTTLAGQALALAAALAAALKFR